MPAFDQEIEERSESRSMRRKRSYTAYAALIALYNLLFGGFLLFYRKRDNTLERMSPLDMAMLGLATLRMAKLISEDEIAAVLREPVSEDVNGQKVPQGGGLRRSLGKLLLCPTCTGTWIAAFLTYALHLWPRQTRPLLAMLSASGVSQFSDAVLSLVYTDRDLLRKEQADD
jgi:hypothetical protein